jgi:hypothetical protein
LEARHDEAGEEGVEALDGRRLPAVLQLRVVVEAPAVLDAVGNVFAEQLQQGCADVSVAGAPLADASAQAERQSETHNDDIRFHAVSSAEDDLVFIKAGDAALLDLDATCAGISGRGFVMVGRLPSMIWAQAASTWPVSK